MEKNTYTKEFEKSCTNAILLLRVAPRGALSLVHPCQYGLAILALSILTQFECQRPNMAQNKSTRSFVGVPTCFLVFLKGLWSTVWKWNFLVNEKFFCWRASFWNFFNRKALVFSHSFASCRVNFNENLWLWYPFNFFQKLKEVSLSFLHSSILTSFFSIFKGSSFSKMFENCLKMSHFNFSSIFVTCLVPLAKIDLFGLFD